MSEETITTISNAPKQKDPRRVEAGKKLALISKEAKARKKLERENEIKKEASYNSETLQTVVLVGGVLALGGLVYYLKSTPTQTPLPTRKQTPSPTQKPTPTKRAIYTMDDD